MASRVLVALGGNLGPVEETFHRACLFLSSDIFEMQQSPIYRTTPVFDKPGAVPGDAPDYLNAAICGLTYWEPAELLGRLQAAENAFGRERSVPCAPRTLDLDLLLYEDRVLDLPELVLPHPRMHTRWFVLKPAVDIAPDWVHPVLDKTLCEILSKLSND